MNQSHIPLKEKLMIVLPLGIGQISLYLIINHYPLFEPVVLPLTFVDRAIPFLAWTIWPYMLMLVSELVLPLLIRSRKCFLETVKVYTLAMLATFSVFVFFPTIFPRLQFQDPSLFNPLFHWTVSIDSPTCCFPSGHIVATVISWWGLARDRPQLRLPLILVFVPISVTILTTKQHFFVDLIAGIAMAYFFIWLLGHKFSKPLT